MDISNSSAWKYRRTDAQYLFIQLVVIIDMLVSIVYAGNSRKRKSIKSLQAIFAIVLIPQLIKINELSLII